MTQAFIDELIDEIIYLRAENDRLKAENSRLGGKRGIGTAIQERTCIHCHRRMPDGPAFFPGYLEAPCADYFAEI